ncbi:HD domain-containing protein [Agromyces sp. NPDC049794]|uniref:HD domain-containing protein n=1 Tax=unclassified Agromyces TaxID=2639701 RepID=UPI0033CD2E70
MQPMVLAEVPHPETRVAHAAREVATEFCSPALLNHSLRSYVWAASYGVLNGIAFDEELLYVSALLHDIGLVREFDSHDVGFEYAGAAVAWVFGASAVWSPERRRRAGEVIIAHMASELVGPETDPEGHLLSVATSLDISGARLNAWPVELRSEVIRALPRAGLAEEFVGCFKDQASRKPHSSPALAIAEGIEARVAANPLDQLDASLTLGR